MQSNQERPNVAFIEPVGGHGGMNHYNLSLCSGVASGGGKVCLYTHESSQMPDDIPFKVSYCFRGIYGSDHKLIRALRYFRILASCLVNARLAGCKVAHFNFFHATVLEFTSIILAKALGMKTVATAHDVESFAGAQQNWLAKLVYRSLDQTVAHSSVAQRELIERLGVRASRIRRIPHMHYLDFVGQELGKSEARRKLGLSEDGPVILFFGQIKRVKGLEVLLEALPRVVERHPKVKLVIAGKLWKDDFSRYETLIQASEMGDNVELRLGFIPEELVDQYFYAADIVALPYHKIYQSGVVLLSMSYGRAVIVSDIDGMTEVVAHGINGLVFKEGDPSDLAEKLCLALTDTEQTEAIAKGGRNYVAQHHDWREIGRQLIEAYQLIGK